YLVSKLDLRGKYTSTYLARSFFAGFALYIAIYFISDLLGSSLLLWITGPVICIVYIVDIHRNRDGRRLINMARSIASAPASFYFFAMMVFLSSMLTTQYSYISPLHAAFSTLKIDFAYHAGIINALSQGFPPLDPWIAGRTIEYHLFTEMLYSIPVRLLDISSVDILMSCTPYIITPVFTVSLYSFYKELAGKKDRAGIYCLATHFANMFMVRQWVNSWLLFHIYSNINNAGMGLSCLLVILPLIKIWDRKEENATVRVNTKEMIFFGVLVMLTTGIKGPVSIVLVAALIGTVILGVILKSVNRGMIALTGISCIGFILVYVYILGAQHSNETGGDLINFWEVTDIFFLKQDVLEAGPKQISYPVLLLSFLVFYLTAFFLPFIIGYVREFILVITRKKDFVFSRVVIYAACLVGFAAMMILDFAGHSQVYFGFVTSLLVPIISFWFLEDVCDDRRAWIKAVRGVFYVSMCVTVISSFLYMYDMGLSAKDTYLLRDQNTNPYRNISTKEYEGMEWLRHNTPENAMIASDRYNSSPLDEYDPSNRGDNTHFAYAVYSARRQYMEGAGFSLEEKDTGLRIEMIQKNDALYDPDNEDRGRQARALGVDYLVVSKRINKAVDLSNDEYEKCFSNEEIDIYSIK
ncbi:MAG: hypothetical protein IJJ03_08300, partial [Mogibacterium sp.]|nr:hypothetical protein [Mogibacterium sp.]